MKISLTTKKETAMLKKYSSGTVLEIGTYCGSSALTLAKNADIVHTLDIYQGTPAMGNKSHHPGYNFEAVKNRVAGKNIKAYKEDSGTTNILKNVLFDVIYVDGDHGYPGVHRDFCRWYDQIKKGGLMIFHDYDEPLHPGVVKQVNAAISEGLLKKIDQVDSLIVCEK